MNQFNRDLARELLRSKPGVERPRVLCSHCNLTKETGLCPGCQKYFCASCCGPHFNPASLGYCLELRIEPALFDPLQLLVNSKLLEDLCALGEIEVAGVDAKGRRLYRKL